MTWDYSDSNSLPWLAGTVLCNLHGVRHRGSTIQALENDPVNKDRPLEGAVHQVQESWELHWGPITTSPIEFRLALISAQVKLGPKGQAHKLKNLCV